MYQGYQDRSELEDELYKEAEDSEGSESDVNSELEFQLYSQLHYSSIARELGDDEDRELDEGAEEKGKVDVGQQPEVTEAAGDGVGEHNGLEENLPVSHDEGGQRKQRKLSTTSWKKIKKQKVEQQGDDDKRRVSSSAFKEVIVIDSSPEDITISETDTDDGVCLLKGRTSNSRKPLQTSTPSQRTPQKRKSSSSLEPIVVLDSEDSAAEFESEPEPDSAAEFESEPEPSGSVSDSESESDGLENWMILGSGNQEGDQSISLNVVGAHADDNTVGGSSDGGGGGGGGGGPVSWSVSNKDREAQICNKRDDKDGGVRLQGRRGPVSRYFPDKKVTCHNCNKTGHLSKNCPTPKKSPPCFLCGNPGHRSYDCPGKHCNNCGRPGHLFDQCSERAYWFKQCHRCGVKGHFLDACPEIWRQYHITSNTGPPVRQMGNDPGRTPPYCYNCSRRGHFGHACPQARMFKGVFANAPFINHYDTRVDIKSRERRIKKQLPNVDGLLSTSQRPETPGPPKKRQKTNNYSYASHHQDPSHHSNQRSHQSPIIHKPSNSHIRFNKSATKFTPKKADRQSPGSSGPGKRWEPKREVPATRDQLPPAAARPPAKVVFDEADDLPRGRPAKVVFDEADDLPRGRHREGGEKKCKKVNKNGSKGPPGVPFKPNACTSDRLFGPARPGQAKKRRAPRGRGRDRKRAAATEMYPTDENLFIIKQRKRQR